MEYEELNEKFCQFKADLKQTMDLLNDAYRWKLISENCENNDHKQKYLNVSNVLFELFMEQHNEIGKKFKSE